MIRTVDKVPDWVYEFVTKVQVTKPVLECIVLDDAHKIVVTHTMDYKTAYSDWYSIYKPVATIPYKENRTVVVYYSPDDSKYEFNHIDDYKVYYMQEGGVKMMYIIFRYPLTGNWYIVRSKSLGVNTA